MLGAVSGLDPITPCRDHAGVDRAGKGQAGSVHTPQRMQTNKDYLARTTQARLRQRGHSDRV